MREYENARMREFEHSRMTRRAQLASQQKFSSKSNITTREKVVRSTLLQGWVGAALKGESGGVTRIRVKKSRFVDFLTSQESQQKWLEELASESNTIQT